MHRPQAHVRSRSEVHPDSADLLKLLGEAVEQGAVVVTSTRDNSDENGRALHHDENGHALCHRRERSLSLS